MRYYYANEKNPTACNVSGCRGHIRLVGNVGQNTDMYECDTCKTKYLIKKSEAPASEPTVTPEPTKDSKAIHCQSRGCNGILKYITIAQHEPRIDLYKCPVCGRKYFIR